jgi:hypothetical protein
MAEGEELGSNVLHVGQRNPAKPRVEWEREIVSNSLCLLITTIVG